jgi:hypothetical protein
MPKSGDSVSLRPFTWILLTTAMLVATVWAGDKKPAAGRPYSVIAGTVFREPGFALPGAQVWLTPDPPVAKKKPEKTMADSRGEFAFRVAPPKESAEPARYTVSVKAEGYVPQEKPAVVAAEQRVDVYFELKPVAK